jgi:hypothetical protein
LKPAVWPLTDVAYDVLELARPCPADAELIESPRGEEDDEDPLCCGLIWGRVDTKWDELYQVSTGPRAWTDEIDGSSSFTVLSSLPVKEWVRLRERVLGESLESDRQIAERIARQARQTVLYNSRVQDLCA